MKKSMRTGAVAVGLAAMVIAGTGAAYASHTKVSVNGSTAVGTVAYTATNYSSAISFTTNFGVEMDCGTAGITGNINQGTSVAIGNTIGTIGSLSFGGCTMGPFGLTVAMTGGNIDVLGHPTNAGDPVPVKITGVSATITAITGGTCSFKAGGFLTGEIKSQSGTDAVLKLNPASFAGSGSGFNLDITNVFGCAGEVVNGDTAGAWYTDTAETLPSIFEIDSTGPVTHS